MKRGTAIALVSGALVTGLALGTAGLAFAAPTATTPGANTFGARMGAVCRQAGGTIAEIVAKVTGQSEADVYAARQDGKSFADIAKAKGVSADTLTTDVVSARKAALDAAVKAGTITQAQADLALTNMKANISAKVAAAAPEGCIGTGAGAGRGAGVGAGRGTGGGGAGGGRGCAGGCIAQP